MHYAARWRGKLHPSIMYVRHSQNDELESHELRPLSHRIRGIITQYLGRFAEQRCEYVGVGIKRVQTGSNGFGKPLTMVNR